MTLAGELDPDDHAVEHYDAVLAAEPIDDETPHVILDDRLPGGDPTGNILRRAAAVRRRRAGRRGAAARRRRLSGSCRPIRASVDLPAGEG